jgi:hypothetical protein
MVPYKKWILIVEAFEARPPDETIVSYLVMIPEMSKIKNIATKNIELLGHVSLSRLLSIQKKPKLFCLCSRGDFWNCTS